MERGRKPAVLVTGGAGYIGAHTAKALAERRFLPVVFARKSSLDEIVADALLGDFTGLRRGFSRCPGAAQISGPRLVSRMPDRNLGRYDSKLYRLLEY
jgi:nucleoside-diphosphate-sugar epimerase